MDKRIDVLHKSLNQNIDTMQSSINSLNNQPQVLEKGRFPSQTLPNPRGVHELSFPSEPAKRKDEVQAIITLRSGKEIKQPMPKSTGKTREKEEEGSEHIFIKEDSMKESTRPPSPFPQALRGKKKASKKEGILEVLRQVKVNIPLLEIPHHLNQHWRDLHRQGIAGSGSQCQPIAILNIQAVRFGGAEVYQHHPILSISISENTKGDS